ncbi:phosphoglycerate mutase [Pseudomarimonas arenosa]|uniref:Phosphoglycerate mutase n=1 Tax=Pseudomarimonas arenosa TaxID=2774145 RepID=A0AAW3ZLB6_9GAMM|nr:phosphoglycerate mutase [Pseudomarimonas arenosa]MBD8526309.1 phosphoglycerate mutase [Pseudomarimonas arenosa]
MAVEAPWLLLPAWSEIRGPAAARKALTHWLGQCDRLESGKVGRQEQWLRVFDVLPRRLAMAPLTRHLDADDAAHRAWLRCDPVHLRADGPQARLLAFGESLRLSEPEAEALMAPLRPILGDHGVLLSAPKPDRWYGSIAVEAVVPLMSSPDQALGEDVLPHLPEGAQAARWRQLWNECQVVLHQHPVNAKRAKAGLPTINSLWFWGAGVLPDSVRSVHSHLLTRDELGLALARLAKLAALKGDEAQWPPGAVIDLQHLRNAQDLADAVLPAVRLQATRHPAGITLDFADGQRLRWRHAHRWRFWRRPVGGFPPATDTA